MKKFLVRILGGMVWPMIKTRALEFVDSEELQQKYVKMLNDKMDIPDVPEEMEKKLLDAAYDVAQILARENIEKIDIDKIADSL